MIPDKRIAYTWRYEGNSLVTFKLFEKGNRTQLRLIHSGLEAFPADNKDLAKENFAAGWNEIIDSMLPAYLNDYKVIYNGRKLLNMSYRIKMVPALL